MCNVNIVMETKNNAIVERNTCFRDVLEEMNAKRLGAVNVVDEGRLVGIITDGDVRRLILKTQDMLPDLFLVNAGDLMITDPKTISPDSSLEDCLEILKKYRFWVLPVVEKDGSLLGMVHMHTLLRAMERKNG